MTVMINLNADMGEGFCAYNIGADDEILMIIRSASIACSFHAGDRRVMRKVVHRAKRGRCQHRRSSWFQRPVGFGRRRIDMRLDDFEYMVAYQIGAVQGMATYVGEKVTHLKPHGTLNNAQ